MLYAIKDRETGEYFAEAGYLQRTSNLSEARIYNERTIEGGLESLKDSVKIQKDLRARLSPESMGVGSEKHDWCVGYDTSRIQSVKIRVEEA